MNHTLEWIACVCVRVIMCAIIKNSAGIYGPCMDQKHSSDQADTSQPAAETQLSAARLVSHFVSVKPNT